MIGLAARTSLELRLHTEGPVENIDEAPRLRNHEIFSCVYDLDKRCSFFADLRWTLHYKDIDTQVLNVVCPFPCLQLIAYKNETELTVPKRMISIHIFRQCLASIVSTLRLPTSMQQRHKPAIKIWRNKPKSTTTGREDWWIRYSPKDCFLPVC